jgi:hypothetical protein
MNIDERAEAIKQEIRSMAEQALRDIDRRLGMHPHFTARSIAQRRRYARQRLLKEQTA